MNTGRWLIVLGVAGTIGILVLISFLFWPKVGITSTKSVLAGQSLNVYFTDPVKGYLDVSRFYVTKSNKKLRPSFRTETKNVIASRESCNPGTIHCISQRIVLAYGNAQRTKCFHSLFSNRYSLLLPLRK